MVLDAGHGFRGDHGEAIWRYIAGKIPAEANTEEVAVQNYYYCHHEDGERKFIGEHGLSKLESIALPMLNQIRARNFKLTPDDRLTFAGYVANAHTRVPTFERQLNSFYALMNAKTIEHIASSPVALESVARRISGSDGETISGEQLRAKLVGGSVIVGQESRGWSIRRMFQMIVFLQEVINSMTWTFLVADEHDYGFLTTDNPVALYDPAAPHGVAFESSPYAHFMFPVCRTVCLLATHQEKAFPVSKFSASEVREVNKYCILRADHQVYAPFKSDAVQKLLDEHVKRSRRKRVLLNKGRAVVEDVPDQDV